MTTIKPIFQLQAETTAQGSGRIVPSPDFNTQVTTSGVVTGVVLSKWSRADDSGVFIQDPTGDANAVTSDGIFIHTPDAAKYAAGDALTVTGTLGRYHGLLALDGDLSIDRTGRGMKLPEAVALDVPADAHQSAAYLRSVQSMRVTTPVGIVLTGSNDGGIFTAAPAATWPAHRYTGTGEELPPTAMNIATGDDAVAGIAVNVSDTVSPATGPLGYSYGQYVVNAQSGQPNVTAGMRPPVLWGDADGDGTLTSEDVRAIRAAKGADATGMFDARDLTADGRVGADDAKLAAARLKRMTSVPASASKFSIAACNVENLFSPDSDPVVTKVPAPTKEQYAAKLATLAHRIHGDLGAPTFVTIEEAGDRRVLEDLVAQPELAPDGYQVAHMESADSRGIDVAVLYRGDVAALTGLKQLQGQARLPSRDSKTPVEQNIFARQPLVADFTITDPATKQQHPLTVIANHFMAQIGGRDNTEVFRLAQATFLRDQVAAMRAADSSREFIVAGDFNAGDDRPSIGVLTGSDSPLVDLGKQLVPLAERYSTNRAGVTDALDHLFVTPGLVKQAVTAGIRHLNSDFSAIATKDQPARVTDHDSPYATFTFASGAQAAATK